VTQALTFIVPGDIQTRTGGYIYDRRLIQALQARGWSVQLRQLDGGFPNPDARARSEAATLFTSLADDTLVIVDGLALGVLPDEVLPESGRLRIVALVHHPLAFETGLTPMDAARLAASERRALAAARHVVVTSPATARALEVYGVSAANVSVVLPGTDLAELAVGSGTDSVRLLCVASIVPRKGHSVLISALERIRELKWHLVCCGSQGRDPATAATLTAQIDAAGLTEHVAFLGELSESALAREYAQADVFVLPTLYEGFGMVVAEAVARGLPVVATDTGGVRAILRDADDLVVFPGDVNALTEALRRVIGDPQTRAAMTAASRRVRERLVSWDQAAGAMEQVLIGVPGS
jgi:glycosyltransferase involved in cell wall biosynthesis